MYIAGATVLLGVDVSVRAVDTATLQRYLDTVCFITAAISYFIRF